MCISNRFPGADAAACLGITLWEPLWSLHDHTLGTPHIRGMKCLVTYLTIDVHPEEGSSPPKE